MKHRERGAPCRWSVLKSQRLLPERCANREDRVMKLARTIPLLG
jgi:hypothetical protein